MKFYLIDENGADVIDIDNTNEAINKALHWKDSWGCYNESTVFIGGRKFLIVSCDLGKTIGLPISALPIETFKTGKLAEPFMVGSILVTKFDGIDDYEALDDVDIEILKKHTGRNDNANVVFKEFLVINTDENYEQSENFE